MSGVDSRKNIGIPSGQGSVADDIRKAVKDVFKKGYPSHTDIIELTKRFPKNDDLLDSIILETSKSYSKEKEKAKKLAAKIHKLLNEGRTTHHEILTKIAKLRKEKNMSDQLYEEFEKQLKQLLSGYKTRNVVYTDEMLLQKSRINRALGHPSLVEMKKTSGINMKKEEGKDLAAILQKYNETIPLHRATFMRSLLYKDCSIMAMTGSYSTQKDANNYIHPVLACMFLPKIDVFEKHFLHSNFGSIINTRNNGEMIMAEADSLLYQDITSDPNDVVCNIDSPIADLKHRYMVQIELWDTVSKLRRGQYYESAPVSKFIEKLNMCRNNIYDDVDLSFNQDEGAFLKRLLSVFSFRPTLVSTRPVNSLAGLGLGMANQPVNQQLGFNNRELGFNLSANLSMTGGYHQSPLHFNSSPVYTVTSVPMLTAQIPMNTRSSKNREPVDLRSCMSQTIWINSDGTINPREHSVIYSRQVLIFYVNRRVQRLNIQSIVNPLAFAALPSYYSMSNFERLNDYPVNIPEQISLTTSGESFVLRSVVAVTETAVDLDNRQGNVIVGCTALIAKPRDMATGEYDSKYYLYDPFGASIPVRHKDGYVVNKPITQIESHFSTGEDEHSGKSFFDRASTNGTVFIYVRPKQDGLATALQF